MVRWVGMALGEEEESAAGGGVRASPRTCTMSKLRLTGRGTGRRPLMKGTKGPYPCLLQ